MLQLIDIEKSFSGVSNPVLKKINLHLNPGDFCVVIGSNGSGKSTLMKVISGEYTSHQGQIIIQGEDLTQQKRSHLIASVIQDVNKGTVVEMTLLENMIFSLSRVKQKGFSRYARQARTVINELKAFGTGLERYIHTPLSHLSGGQRQMVATMMAIVAQPKLLLLDEHTSALDPSIQKTLMAYTQKAITTKRLTSIMITHSLEDAIQYGNRLIMLHKGNVILDIANEAKSALKVNQLLNLFHHYEDLDLMRTSS